MGQADDHTTDASFDAFLATYGSLFSRVRVADNIEGPPSSKGRIGLGDDDDRPADASFDAFLGYLGDDQTREDASSPRDDDDGDVDATTSSSFTAVVAPNVPRTNGPSSSPFADRIIGDTYRIIGNGMLGEGLSGCVRECAHVVSGRRYAVKSIARVDDDDGDATREASILRRMSHPNVVRLVDAIEDDDRMHLVMDLCAGGSLFDGIVDRRGRRTTTTTTGAAAGGGCYGEDDASRMVREVLDAVSYMHERGIVHRDIKAENVLFVTKDADSPIRVIDFGLAVDGRIPSERGTMEGEGGVDASDTMTDAVGSPYYVAPEVLRGRYGMSCDVWSVGVLAYVLLCGYPPFNGVNRTDVYRSVLAGRYRFPSRDWDGITPAGLDFVKRLLEVDVARRMTAREALMHPWITRKGCGNDIVVRGGASARGGDVSKTRSRQSTTPERRANVRGFDLVHWVNRKVHAQ
jgi:hypothetical protein